ncbi:MAG: cyclic-di-AMP receptor [Patescibacteria group bacterium]
MKLIVAVVQDQDVGKLLARLAEEGIGATKLASTGGFLRQGNTTLLVGVEQGQVERVVGVIKETCHSRKQLVTPMAAVGRSINSYLPNPIEVSVGGATVFVLDVEGFTKV